MSANKTSPLNEFTIRINTDLVTSASPNFRLPTWPPPRDWPVVIDRDGKIVSRYGDPRWDLTPWHGKSMILDFGDGETRSGSRAPRLDTENADIMRKIAIWLAWGPNALETTQTLYNYFKLIKTVVAKCSHSGISAARLMRHPKVLESVAESMAQSSYDTTILLLHRIHDNREVLGFTIADAHGIKQLINAAPDYKRKQTQYIPARIWTYQVTRLHECLMDFLAYQEKIEACFRFCLDAYAKNYGSLQGALASGRDNSKNPFSTGAAGYAGSYHGKFFETAARFDIAELLVKWATPNRAEMTVSALSTYLSVVRFAGLAYIANFTLQRMEEVGSLRTDCLIWEYDEKFGRLPIIRGETTKTDPDSDARWIASPSVEAAVDAASAVARLRMLCDRENPTLRPIDSDQKNPYLNSASTEPWGAAHVTQQYAIRSRVASIGNELGKCGKQLFDLEQLRITSADLMIARRLNPGLDEAKFAVGRIWLLTWHQYRRTGAVNMFSSGLISDSSMQQMLKHATRLMSLYYGRNHGSLHLNKDVAANVVNAMYEAQAEKLTVAASGDRFVSPHSPEHKDTLVVRVLSAKEVKGLIAMSKRGTISFRENRLGGCMKSGACEYGGIESVARCAGGNGDKPCTDALFDREKEVQVRADMRRVTLELERLSAGHPRYNALIREYKAMENFINVISTG